MAVVAKYKYGSLLKTKLFQVDELSILVAGVEYL
jgi:hypothetical protein